MALRVTRWSFAAAVLALACDRSPAPAPAPPQAAVAARADRELPAKAARAQVQAMLAREMVRPQRFAEQRCPDAELGSRPAAARELSLRVVDARYDKRRVIPMRVTRHVTAPDLNRLDQVLAGVEAPQELAAAATSVERLSRQRYVGVHHVVHYVAPKWVVRVGRVKPIWEAGRLDSWFAVHEAETGKALCATRITVIGDATGAPIRVRLRSETRDRLTDSLGDGLRRATSGALARISGALLLPGAAGDDGDDAAESLTRDAASSQTRDSALAKR
jgi:hypothetical protein